MKSKHSVRISTENLRVVRLNFSYRILFQNNPKQIGVVYLNGVLIKWQINQCFKLITNLVELLFSLSIADGYKFPGIYMENSTFLQQTHLNYYGYLFFIPPVVPIIVLTTVFLLTEAQIIYFNNTIWIFSLYLPKSLNSCKMNISVVQVTSTRSQ